MFPSIRLRLTWVFLLLVPVVVFAQGRNRGDSSTSVAAEIHGQIRYAEGGTPAAEVMVRLERFGGGIAAQVVTDRNGKFRFTGIGQAIYLVNVRAPGFRDVQQQVDLRTNYSEFLSLQLVPEKTATMAEANPLHLRDASVPDAAQQEFAKGRALLLEKQQTAEGIKHLEKAVALYPKFLEAHLLLGTAYMETQQWTKAEKPLQQVLVIEPKTAAALLALGEVYRQERKYAEAEKALLAGLKLDDRAWQGYFTLGRVYFAQNKLEQAGPAAGRALQLKPDLAEAYLLAGNIMLRVRQPENALTMFEAYLRLAPKGESAAEARGMIEQLKRALAEKKK